MSKRYTIAALLCFAMLAAASRSFGQDFQAAKKNLNQLIAVLKSDASREAKADALRQLAVVAPKEAVPAIAALLPSEELNHMARYALEPIPDPSVDEAFRAALGNVKGKPLVGVIGSIGVRKDAGAVPVLAKFLADPDPVVAEAAARALGKIGTVDAGKAIASALPTAPAGSQLYFCEGLLRCAEAMTAKEPAEAVAVYDRLRAMDAHHQVRTGAIRGAILARGKNGLPLLKEYLASKQYPLFQAAVHTTIEMSGAEVTAALAEAATQASADGQVLITLAMGKRGDPAALPALFAMVKAPSKEVQAAALRAVAEIGGSPAIAGLVQLMASPDAQVASLATQAFASIPGRQADDIVASMLASADNAKRIGGIELAARRRMKSAMPALLKAAADSDANVRSAAMRRLGELADSSDLPTLLDLLLKAKADEVGAAEQAVGAVCVRAEKPEASVQRLVAALPQAGAAQQSAIIRVLGAVGGAEALKAVRGAAVGADTDRQVRITAIRALSTWKTTDAAPDLLFLARNSTNENDKILALNSYLRMANRGDIPAEQRLAMCKEAAPLVQRNEEKRLLIADLAAINTIESLNLILPYAQDQGAKQEAIAAILNSADRMIQRRQTPAGVLNQLVPLLEKVAAAGNENQAQRANALIAQAKRNAGQNR